MIISVLYHACCFCYLRAFIFLAEVFLVSFRTNFSMFSSLDIRWWLPFELLNFHLQFLFPLILFYALISGCWLVVNQTWSQPMLNGTLPVPRDSHSCTTVGENLYVFGGTDGMNPLKDLRILDTCEWSCPWFWFYLIFLLCHALLFYVAIDYIS